MAHDQPWLVDEFASPTAVLDTPTFSVYPSELCQKNQVLLTHIFIRDPPSKWPLTAKAEQFGDSPALFLTRFPGKSNEIPTADVYINLANQLPIYTESTKFVPSHSRRQKVRMAKKRRSLQSIFTPSFLNAPPSPTSTDSGSSYFPNPHTTRMRSFSSAEQAPYNYPAIQPESSQSLHSNTSPRASPPPTFLLDDDPFANLSAAPATSRPVTIVDTIPTAPPEPLPAKPRSPLTPSTPEIKATKLSSPTVSHTIPVGVSRALSSRARPAYQKPAFAPRPSLPSLHTLASMNIVLTKKVRKGRVGAGLPFEPWDIIDNGISSGESSIAQSPSPSSTIILPTQSGTADFVSDLDLNFLDLSDEDNDDTDTSHFADTSAYDGIFDTLDSSQHDLFQQSESSARASLDDLSPPPLSRTVSSETSSLTRSTSTTSNSSAGSFDAHPWANYSANMSSTESDSDILSSPPDDFLTFPTSRYSDDALYDSFSYDNNAHEALFSDVNFLGEPGINYEPGTSAGTIRPPVEPEAGNKLNHTLSMQSNDGEPTDSGGWNEHRPRHGTVTTGSGRGQSSNSGGINGNDNLGNSMRQRGYGGRDDDSDDGRRRPNHSTFSTPSDSDTSNDTEDESADDYGQPVSGSAPVASGSSSVSDDDVPLAQRIPTALRAQRTIRRQVREERDQRRKERALRAEQSSARVRQTTLRPGTNETISPQLMSSSQEAALHASRSITRPRPRTRTLPASEMRPFAPEDLSRRLEAMGTPDVPISRRSASTSRKSKDGIERPSSAGRGLKDPVSTLHHFSSPSQNSPSEPVRSLRPSRSFHRLEGRKVEDHRAPIPADAAQQLSKSVTRARPRDGSVGSHGAIPRSFPSPASPDLVRSGEEGRKLTKVNPAQTSIELERPPRPSLQRPPVPPLPASEAIVNGLQANRGSFTHQRIFVGDMQRFNMIELGPSTSAGDVIDILEAQGALKGWVGSGGWMVWEIAQDFGMERPIRSFELLADVQASWNKDKMLNTFIVKLTPLALVLSRSAIPTASPTYSGYVEWEVKRGKWNKRWLQLREHSLWLSKRDNGRDETLICSLSNFDAYRITRLQKTPRPFAFAVKSTDNLSFFENTADYLHMFSCSEKEGKAWMENILLARSYVLHQERQVLFNPKAPNGNAAGAGALSRSGTRKRPVQPLVAVSPPFTGVQLAHSGDVFEPGSLLHKA